MGQVRTFWVSWRKVAPGRALGLCPPGDGVRSGARGSAGDRGRLTAAAGVGEEAGPRGLPATCPLASRAVRRRT
uniref:P.troglodytes triose-phosphate isomerase (TPI) protein n=1 Tax=Pan troglodytes TaxID=9598 RepID=V9GZE7_PANTR|nr:hypothetical 7.5K protein (TPI intron 1) - chimpanzee [Pan troglodytes]AAA35439.1 putative [Pan troglodytes]